MVTTTDLIPLPFSTDLPAAGCLFACQGLLNSGSFESASRYASIRQSSRQVVVELALQRFLEREKVPFSREVLAPFSAPHYASLVLGRRICQVTVTACRCQVRSGEALWFERLEIEGVELPVDRGLPDAHEDDELVFFTGLGVPASPAGSTAEEIWVHPLPRGWAQPERWASLGELAVFSGSPWPLEVHLDGQDGQRRMVVETMQLLPRSAQISRTGFYSLATLRAGKRPDRKITLQASREVQTLNVQPHQWALVWQPGIQLTLLGYLSLGEIRRWRRAHPIEDRLPLDLLFPVAPLVERVRKMFGV